MDVSRENTNIGASAFGRERGADKVLLLGLAACLLITFAPTVQKLIAGPWRTEQEGHGPLIILAVAWLAWQCKAKLQKAHYVSAPVAGWLVLLIGLALLILCRSQDVLMLEVAAQLPILAGCILLVGGWQVLRILAFPLAFLLFSVPPPGWMMDAFTVPLKSMVSDWVAALLYDLDYPVAQNGVMIMIGPYELMVKDACAGMNSIFALSAIGVFYIHEFVRGSWLRAIVLLFAIVPITIAANFFRVVALVLMAYYFGVDAIDGVFHDLTGLALFVVALVLFFLLDGALILLIAGWRRAFGAAAPHASELQKPVSMRA